MNKKIVKLRLIALLWTHFVDTSCSAKKLHSQAKRKNI